MESRIIGDPSVDEMVEQLLRDQDFLLSKEIKQKVAELNKLLMQAHSQQLKIEPNLSRFETHDGGTVLYLDLRLYKEI